MKYQAGKRRKAAEYEKALVEWWKKHRIFERSVEERPIDESYVFYDGPPFITGLPHHGTLLSSIVKDAVPRFWTMRGKRVERRWGWDCHGLPAENFVEKQLGITDRREIGTKWSLEEYILKARESMVANSETWEGTIDRIGRWVDFKGAYRTMDRDYMESVWWAFKTLYDAGKIYEGAKVLMYDTKFATPVSKSEVTMDNDAYQEVTDPSAFVKFRLAEAPAFLETLDSRRVARSLSRDAEVPRTIALTSARQTSSDTGSSKVSQKAGASAQGTCPLAKSYLLGVKDGKKIAQKLRDLGAKFTEKDGDFLVELKPEQISAYEKIVDAELQNGFWNEIINSDEVRFAFKQNDQIQRLIWHDGDNEAEILALCNEFAQADFASVRKMLADNEFYRDVFDKIYFLAWTTTPWTLPANMALAVNAEMDYVAAKMAEKDEVWILAKSRAEKVLADLAHEIVAEFKGADLVGAEYEWAFAEKRGKVFAGDFVGADDGTGIVHIAPAYGEDDFELCKREGIEYEDVLDEYGCYLPETQEKLEKIGVRPDENGKMQIWEVNKFIAKCLEERGIVAKIEYVKHDYPFNPRSKTRIIYRAVPSWFFDVQGSKPLMLAQNENINWFPEYLKHGRFAKNIEQAPDWNLSRDRFWATAMPVWKGDRGSVKVVGSYAELEELSGVKLEDYHRPWVDEITFEIDGEKFTRIEKVLDCWFESGSMPFAQLHYPFENKEKFERNYPADFIVEYVGQVRAWFYYVHCVNSVLASIGAFDQQPSSASADARLAHRMSNTARSDAPASLNPATAQNRFNPFMNVITTGTLAGNDGRKMSKSLGNYTDPNELMDAYSADALRFLLLSSPVLSGEDFALTDKDVSDTQRKLAMIWNVYDFFVTYAEVDQWDSAEVSQKAGASANPLDKWILARLHETQNAVIEGMEAYDIPRATSVILPFVDDLSNWFVRRSRRRFWKSEDDGDKAEAYATLWRVLRDLAILLAPFTPFLAEELWQNMAGDWEASQSVHLLNYPEKQNVDAEILAEMARVREVINDGLSLRMQKSETEEQIKVRQPLAKLVYAGEKLPAWGEEIVCDEVNVKAVDNSSSERISSSDSPVRTQRMSNTPRLRASNLPRTSSPMTSLCIAMNEAQTAWLDKTITPELADEGWARELVRAVQAARKKAGLNVDDRIKLSVGAEIPKAWREMAASEVLAENLTCGAEQNNYAYDEIVKVNGENVTISLEKA